ncbi:hypothetical protein MMPV_008328 [Pyropia vietnamensis]
MAAAATAATAVWATARGGLAGAGGAANVVARRSRQSVAATVVSSGGSAVPGVAAAASALAGGAGAMIRREAGVWLRVPRGGHGGGAPAAACGMATTTPTATATGGGAGVSPRPPLPSRRAGPSARAEAAAAAAAARAAATRERNRSLAAWMTAVVAATVGLSYASVPLYRVFCQVTGFGGTTRGRVGAGGDDADGDAFVTSTDATRPVAGARPITIRFNADVSAGMPWRFTPATTAARVRPGETALAFYTAENLGDTPLTGIATYNVTPAKVGIYFNKVQCFCFDEQRLAGGEVVDMPVFFFLDPEFAADERMADVDEVTLSYTFFRAEDVSMEELQEAHTRVWEAAMKDLDAAGTQKGGGGSAPLSSAPVVPARAPAVDTSTPVVATSATPVAMPAAQAEAAPAAVTSSATARTEGTKVGPSASLLDPAAARAPGASAGAPAVTAVVEVPAPTAPATGST